MEKTQGFYISTAPSGPSDNNKETVEDEEQENTPMDVVLSSPKKPLAKAKVDETVERSLEAFLFGNTYKPAQSDSEGNSESDEDTESEDGSDDEESEGDIEDSNDDDAEDSSIEASPPKNSSIRRRAAAWSDEDDTICTEEVNLPNYAANKSSKGTYAKDLKEKFVSLMGAPKWADLEAKHRGEEEDDFFRENTKVLDDSGKRMKKRLGKGTLEFRRMKDLNKDSYGEGYIIKSVEFHPSATVGLVSGSNGTVSLFQVDGKNNPKIQTVNFENFPIHDTHFSHDGNEFIVSSLHHQHFYVYDMVKGKNSRVFISGAEMENKGGLGTFLVGPQGRYLASQGRFGNIHFFEARSKEMIFTLKMNDRVRSMAFSSDGSTLYSTGDGGEIYIWDIRGQDCAHRFNDDGCLGGSAVAISGNNHYLATGSNSGIINVYERTSVLNNQNPKPLKIVKNFTTKISSLKFSPSSEILAGTSVVRENAFKLIHTPSMTVFENFPTLNHNYRRVDAMDFSLNGGYFAFGNNRGTAYLYRLQHYESF
eukprot:TRINITY_DN4074_c0_g1_i1.p1 TRINITY_DN4074_c0_g1~~TRINITY_DN4074_c0_g1_i1.p1  ORF type:complete len:542 (-),score=149.82 TRINITY_DN4074_c0_g1_i1:94-1698(-)